MARTMEIPVDQILIPEIRLSSILDDRQRTFLQASIKEVGLINEPVVRAVEGGMFELIAGKSRIAELMKLGAQKVMCKVLDVDKKTSLKMNVIENVARGSWDFISMAELIQELQKEGATLEEISRTFDRSKTWVRRTLMLLELPPMYQEAIRNKRLTPTHIQIASQMPTSQEMDQALQTAFTHHWNTSILKTYVENRLYEIQAAKDLAKARGTQPEIPLAQPEQLIKYKQCLACGYQTSSENTTIIPICTDCIQLIKYLTTQLGPPKEAIEKIYHALKAHYEAQQPKGPLPPSTLEADGID